MEDLVTIKDGWERQTKRMDGDDYCRCLHGDKRRGIWGFPGGSVVKNPPAKAGDMGSILGLARSHLPWSN